MAKDYEMVNHPSHYNKYEIEVIEMMRRIYGTKAVALWCEMTAFKYRMRLGEKPENPIEQDLNKEKWYLDKAKEYKKMLDVEKPSMPAYMHINEDEIPEA